MGEEGQHFLQHLDSRRVWMLGFKITAGRQTQSEHIHLPSRHVRAIEADAETVSRLRAFGPLEEVPWHIDQRVRLEICAWKGARIFETLEVVVCDVFQRRDFQKVAKF